MIGVKVAERSQWPNGPRVDGHGERSRSRSSSNQPRREPCVHQHGDRAGYFRAVSLIGIKVAERSQWPNGPRVDGHGESSRSRSRSNQPRREPRAHQHGDRAGYFGTVSLIGIKVAERSQWPTRSPSRWTRGALQIEIEFESASTQTLRPSARGPCWLLAGRLDDRNQSSRTVPESMDAGRASDRDRVRISLDANPASISTGTVRATSGPSR